MVKKSTSNNGGELKRFTVALEKEDYERLRDIAQGHSPKLSLQYVLQYAVKHFLREADKSGLGNPLENQESDESK